MISNHLFSPLHKKNKRFLIAGPCSVESEKQIIETANALKHLPIDAFRAGLWKPRSRKDSFEGAHESGIPWLKEAAKILNKKVIVEVGLPKHVEILLKNNINFFWIGARTTTNPFSVTELAEALSGSDATVFVKNPVSPDLDLWIGAIERLLDKGISRIGAIHRGFSIFEKSEFRNFPYWEIPLKLKELFPNLTLITDPSHITGNRDLILPVSKKAISLDFDGLMIETHINPKFALSDAKQQLTPKELEILISSHLPELTDVSSLSLANNLQ